MDMQTTIKMMHLSGLRTRDHEKLILSPVSEMEKKDDSGLSRRKKRSVTKNSLPSTCKSGKVYVSLAKFPNILAPDGFYTHYCGNTFLLPVGNDPIVQNISYAIIDAYKSVKTFSPKVLANPSCCTPKTVHNLLVLHMDQGQFSTIRSIPNTKASRCVCKNHWSCNALWVAACFVHWFSPQLIILEKQYVLGIWYRTTYICLNLVCIRKHVKLAENKLVVRLGWPCASWF